MKCAPVKVLGNNGYPVEAINFLRWVPNGVTDDSDIHLMFTHQLSNIRPIPELTMSWFVVLYIIMPQRPYNKSFCNQHKCWLNQYQFKTNRMFQNYFCFVFTFDCVSITYYWHGVVPKWGPIPAYFYEEQYIWQIIGFTVGSTISSDIKWET